MAQHPQAQYWNSIAGEYRAITRINADDFHYGPMLAGESALHLLPELKAGMNALELGCGEGQNSRYLARRGLRCTALDISEKQLQYAREDSAKEGLEIDYRCSSIEDFAFDQAPYDLIHSSHAFEFVAHPFDLVKRIADALKPGGTFVLSTVHPVYNGEWVCLDDEETGDEIWGRFIQSYFHPVDDQREQPDGGTPIVSRAYPVSAWFKAFQAAGLTVQHLEEPAAVAKPAYESDDWREAMDECSAVPTTLILVATK